MINAKRQSRAYRIWYGLKTRCYSKNHHSYKYYGAKGITVCDAWLNSFETFLADMGECPEGLTLDRIDGSLNYTKDNCRWATRREQILNRDCTRRVIYQGVEWVEVELAAHLGVKQSTLNGRIKRGVPEEKWGKSSKFNQRFTYQGVDYSFADLAKLLGLTLSTVHTRVGAGWTEEDFRTALTATGTCKRVRRKFYTYKGEQYTMVALAELLDVKYVTLARRISKGYPEELWGSKENLGYRREKNSKGQYMS